MTADVTTDRSQSAVVGGRTSAFSLAFAP